MASLKDGRKYHEVKPYTRKDGTKVPAHVRTAPTPPASAGSRNQIQLSSFRPPEAAAVR